MDEHCVVGGRFGLAAAMRSQIKPPRCDGLFAAGALRVRDHGFLPSRLHDLDHHSPPVPHSWAVISDIGCCEASSVVQVTRLTLTVPETVDPDELASEIVTALVDRLRDDRGYELATGTGTGGTGTREYPLHPAGSIVVGSEPGTLTVTLEQRHEGIRVGIG
ncbi:hypothetical protein [Mycobacterium europaeum]|uniref:hypothetical protein n=1 Tax=Mycobacterium europaeum TaxID=761804 RepID=UPI00146BE78C|nr:hypothetical protein [Mycobacterium europaeum]